MRARPIDLAALLLAAALLFTAADAGGQSLRPAAVAPEGLAAPGRTFDPVACLGSTLPADSVLSEVSRALRMDEREEALERLDRLEPGVRDGALLVPDDVVLQHRLAALLGARAVLGAGRARIAAARELHHQASRVLALDPGHPGAHHILGRLHAGVLRLDRISRFLATRVSGGDALAGASWDEARRHLELAEREEPCRPEHHVELARLHRERGDPAAALVEVGHAIALTEGESELWVALRRGTEEVLIHLQDELRDLSDEGQEPDGSLSLAAPRSLTIPSGG
jgi:hypothetical protein